MAIALLAWWVAMAAFIRSMSFETKNWIIVSADRPPAEGRNWGWASVASVVAKEWKRVGGVKRGHFFWWCDSGSKRASIAGDPEGDLGRETSWAMAVTIPSKSGGRFSPRWGLNASGPLTRAMSLTPRPWYGRGVVTALRWSGLSEFIERETDWRKNRTKHNNSVVLGLKNQ